MALLGLMVTWAMVALQTCNRFVEKEHQVTILVKGTDGVPQADVLVETNYPASTDFVSAKADASGRCTLKLSAYLEKSEVSVYLRTQEGSVIGQIVVGFPDSVSEIHRVAEVGSMIEYHADGSIRRKFGW